MKNFTYVKAANKAEALAALAAHKDAMVIAGGTNVMLNILSGKANDKTIVDIRNAELMPVEMTEQRFLKGEYIR